MNKVFTIVLGLLLLISALSCGTKSNPKTDIVKNKYLVIYRWIPNYVDGADVTAIALINGEVIYFKKQPSLQIEKNLPIKNGKIIKDEILRKLLETINIKDLKGKKLFNCGCKALSENKFILKTEPNMINPMVLDEVRKCPKSSKWLVVDEISGYFEQLENVK